MAGKRHKPEGVVAKLRQVDVLTLQGKSIAEAVKTILVTGTTYFRWRAEYGGMKAEAAALLWRKPIWGAKDPLPHLPIIVLPFLYPGNLVLGAKSRKSGCLRRTRWSCCWG